MPGKPQVWYLDLFAGKNNLAAVEKAGSGGHKEINRTNLTASDISEGLAKAVVQQQLELLRFRRTCPAFGFDAACTVAETAPDRLSITWTNKGHTASLEADLSAGTFAIKAVDAAGADTFAYPASRS